MRLLGLVGKLLPRFIRERLVRRGIKKALEKAGLPRETAEGLMKGWKTWAGGISMILSGALMVVNAIADEGFSFEAIQGGLGLIGAGFAALGLGHKVDKNTAAVEKT